MTEAEKTVSSHSVHLVSVEFPVQAFLLAGRRLSDMWYSSRAASDLTFTIATALKKHHGADVVLVFPDDTAVAAWARDPDGISASNKIVFQARCDVKKLPSQITATMQSWFAKEAKRGLEDVRQDLTKTFETPLPAAITSLKAYVTRKWQKDWRYRVETTLKLTLGEATVVPPPLLVKTLEELSSTYFKEPEGTFSQSELSSASSLGYANGAKPDLTETALLGVLRSVYWHWWREAGHALLYTHDDHTVTVDQVIQWFDHQLDTFNRDASDSAIKEALTLWRVIDQDVLSAQLREIFELAIVWVAMPDEDDQYQNGMQQLDEAMAARKRTLVFLPNPVQSAWSTGRQKSSFDGRNDAVFVKHPPPQLMTRLRHSAGLSDGESLDSVGLVKRLRGRQDRFPSLTRIAVQCWLTTIHDDGDAGEALLKETKLALEALCSQPGLDYVSRSHWRGESDPLLPYDCQLLYRQRIEIAQHELVGAEASTETLKTLEQLRQAVRKLEKRYGSPPTTIAVIAYDGDHVGEYLGGAKSSKDHRERTRRLSEFAVRVRQHCQDSQFQAQCVFAAGDEGLIFAPAQTAIALAQQLSDSYAETINVDGQTDQHLSVGVVLGHVFERLTTLLQRVREAQKRAKQGDSRTGEYGNALAVDLTPRSGTPITWCCSFNREPGEQIVAWMKAFDDGVFPRGLPYALSRHRELLEQLDNVTQEYPEVIDWQVRRLLRRRVEDPHNDTVAGRLIDRIKENDTLAEVVNELLIARYLTETGVGDDA